MRILFSWILCLSSLALFIHIDCIPSTHAATLERKRKNDTLAVKVGTRKEDLVSKDVEITPDGHVIYPEEREEDPSCVDEDELCEFWASENECDINPNYMLVHCAKSCGTCDGGDYNLEDHDDDYDDYDDGLRSDPRYTTQTKNSLDEQARELPHLLNQVAEYGEPQEAYFPNEEDVNIQLVHLVIRQTVSYMNNFIHAEHPTHRIDPEMIRLCRNEHEHCSLWASQGECEANPSYMLISCSAACRSCDKIRFDTRCPPRSADEPPGLVKGGLNLMFQRIVDNYNSILPPNAVVTVHSRPESPTPQPDTHGRIHFDIAKNLKQKPWVITIDNFLTHEECDRLIELGYEAKYERSKDVGGLKADGTIESSTSDYRTSENAWCSRDCRKDSTVQDILNKMQRVTGIHPSNYEDFQILKYDQGQFYRTHHDYIGHQKDRAAGPRILTFFLYLSDVEEGGATNFPLLGDLSVYPKKGRALVRKCYMDSSTKSFYFYFFSSFLSILYIFWIIIIALA